MSPDSRRPIDWRGWLALAWAIVFGLLYAHAMLQQRAPGVLRRLAAMIGRLG